jgi:hypothetical protein
MNNLAMCEKAEEIQKYFADIDNQLDEDFTMWYYQYPGIGGNWEMKGHFGLLYARSEDYMSTLTKVVMLPEAKHLEEFIPHENLIELDSKFNDFKSMFYENHWFDNSREESLEGRGEDPLDYFKTYDELWLGFVMMDRHQKRWDGTNWVTTDIYPDYFKMNKEIARRDGYPDPDELEYIVGLRGYAEK